MGGTWSNTQDICLHQWENPRVEPVRKTVIVRMIPTGLQEQTFKNNVSFVQAVEEDRKKGGIFANMLKGIRDDEKVVLLGVYLLMVNNEADMPIEVEIRNLFKPCPETKDEEERKHPDFTGTVYINCASKYSSLVEGNDRVLYRPQALNEPTIKKYAGLEPSILNPRTVELPKEQNDQDEQQDDQPPIEVFRADDPLVEYTLRLKHKRTLEPQPGDIVKLESEDSTYYKVEQEFLGTVRQFFKDTIGDYILYTRFEDTHFCVDLPQEIQEKLYNKYHMKAKHPGKAMELPNLTFTIEFSFLLISPGELTMRHKKTPLK